ncbi:MAG TPA: hypothetical protein VLJ42_02265 [Solirubrobacteraceae bacterium]|nr:hypothetical protein [Solirubrobacteraceae bacterium]
MLAVIGIGVGLYFAISGDPGGHARLLAAPVTAAAHATPAASILARPRPRRSPRARPASSPSPSSSSSPSLPTAAAAAIQTPRAHPEEPAERRAVAGTIQRHFSLIRQHQFAAAYALLAPSLQTGESGWISEHQTDGIYSVSVTVDPTLHSGSSAGATIVKMTTLDAHGCKNWSGGWDLVKLEGQWRISHARISATPC